MTISGTTYLILHTFSPAMIHNASLSTASVRRIDFSSRRVIMTSSSLDLHISPVHDRAPAES